MSTILCLKGSVEAVPILERVRALGHRVILVDPDLDCAGARLADIRVKANHYNLAETVLEVHAKGARPDAVLCCACDAPHTAAALAARYSLPGLTVEQAHLSVNKMAQKQTLQAAGLPVPKYAALARHGEFYAWMGGTVIKPVDSRGARGVTLAQNGDDFMTGYPLASKASPTGRVMAEEYVDGPQLSTESIVQDGQVLFTGYGLRNYARLEEFAPHIIEDGVDNWIVTDSLSGFNRDALLAEIDTLLVRACAALGWDNLTVKGDWVLHQGKPVIIELAARLSGGFLASHIIPLAYGYDMVGASIALAAGDLEGPERCYGYMPKPFVSQRYLFPERADIGRTVEAITYPVVADGAFVSYNIKAGDVIREVASHPARLGQATATGATAGEADDRAREFVRQMGEGVRYGIVE